MELVNLGAADGLPPVNWDAVIEKLETGSAPAPDARSAGSVLEGPCDRP